MSKKREEKNKVTDREHHLRLIFKLLGKQGVYYHPVKRACPTRYAFEALYDLGHNRWHSMDKIVEKTIEIMSSITAIEGLSQWDAYVTKNTKREPIDRLKMTILRLTDYNRELENMGCSLEVKGKGYNTHFYLKSSVSLHSSETAKSAFYIFFAKLLAVLRIRLFGSSPWGRT